MKLTEITGLLTDTDKDKNIIWSPVWFGATSFRSDIWFMPHKEYLSEIALDLKDSSEDESYRFSQMIFWGRYLRLMNHWVTNNEVLSASFC